MLEASRHDGIAELALRRPPANALNTALVTALSGALEAETAAGCRAIVLTGLPGMFSGGLDVPELIDQPRAAIHEFWSRFFALCRTLAESPVPVVAAISGHAPAGGAVLTLFCDYRIAVAGRFRIGLNEVRVGLPVPSSILLALASAVGERTAARLAMRGDMPQMEEALALGLVDELTSAEDLMPRAREFALELAALPPVAMNQTRRLARSALVEAMRTSADVEVATEYWFSDETQAQMRALVARLAGG